MEQSHDANPKNHNAAIDDTTEESREAEKRHNRQQAKDAQTLNAPTVYDTISLGGIEEMKRPASSLWWSGVAAGFTISLSLYVMAALRVSLNDTYAPSLEKFGYCFGFVVVVLSRLQLFTENTITPVLPLLKNPNQNMFKAVFRLWSIVFIANLCGTFIAATVPTYLPLFNADIYAAVLDISKHFAHRPLADVFFSAIPAGFMVAAMVWMLPSSKHFEIWTIVLVTYAIAITDTSHVIVGSTELFVVLLNGDSTIPAALSRLVLAAAGNIIGGTVLFATIAYAQVSEEI